MSTRGPAEAVGFALEVMDPRPGARVLEIGTGIAAPAVASLVAPHGSIRSAPDPRGVRGEFDLVYAIGVPAFRGDDPSDVAVVAPLLTRAGQFWVFDEPDRGSATGPLSMAVSALLSRGGFAIVDMLERGRWIAVLAAVNR